MYLERKMTVMLPGNLFFNDFFDDLEPKNANKMMRCDIYEKDTLIKNVIENSMFETSVKRILKQILLMEH